MKTLAPELYPPALHQLGFGGKPLWVNGDVSILSRSKVAIIGTRKPSPQGIARTWKLSRYLVHDGVCIVSGLAEGIDTAAHMSVLDEGGHTIAVLGTPLDQCFPKANELLMQQIAERGLLLSQFESGSTIQRGNFPMRNRLMAALSDLTVVVEATEASGTRYQVAACVKFEKPVGFLRSLADKHYSWVDRAISSGFGFVVTEPEDVTLALTK
jgi:DNA processing protein